MSLQGAGDLAVGLFEMPPEWMSRPLTRVDREVEAETGPPIMRICNLGDGNRSDLGEQARSMEKQSGAGAYSIGKRQRGQRIVETDESIERR